MNIKYGFSKTMDLRFEQILERVTQALQQEGFTTWKVSVKEAS